jgi:NAD(P)-dependent dehydrogenase (short-subunit alcohol dehydrogenase family)
LGAYVIGVGRSEGALKELRAELAESGEAWQCDLGDLDQVQELVERTRNVAPIDVVIHNAGALSASYQITPQRHELTVAVHLLSPYLITRELLNRSTRPSRVIFMTSGGMYAEKFDLDQLEMSASDYRGSVAYARAKRAQVVLTAALAAREIDATTSFYAVHPGWAKTPGVADSLPIFHALTGPLLRSAKEGVDGALWLASVQPARTSGLLWLDRQVRPAHRFTRTKSADDSRDQRELIAWLDAQLSR